MNQRLALIVAGVIFSVVGFVHLLRFLNCWDLIVDNIAIPMSVSIVAFIVSVFLSVWMFVSGIKK